MDTSAYPRTYRRPAVQRIATVVVLGVLGSGLTLAVVLHLLGFVSKGPNDAAYGRDAAILIPICAFKVVTVLRQRATFFADRVEAVWQFTPHTLMRSDVAAYRWGRMPTYPSGSSIAHLILVDRKGSEFPLPPVSNMDDAFRAWLKAFPKLAPPKQHRLGPAASIFRS